jgi:hypothetical protein
MELLDKQVLEGTTVETLCDAGLAELSELQLALVGGGIGETSL